MKIEKINFDSKYNIIKICSKNSIKFYIEKIGYRDLKSLIEYEVPDDWVLECEDLRHIYERFDAPDDLILECIELAEFDKFWGEGQWQRN